MLICSGSTEHDGGSALLYEARMLELKPDGTVDMDWVYRRPIYEMENQPITYGTSWELPILLPLTNEAGTITRYAFFISPAPASVADNKVYYFLGDFDPDTGKFTPDEAFADHPALLDYGSNVFTGLSAFADPVSGNTYLFSIMQNQRSGAEEGASDWAHCVGLTRRIWLNDAGTNLKMEPIDNLRTLEEAPLVELSDVTLEQANDALKAVAEDMLCLRMTVELDDTEEFAVTVKSGGEKDETVFTYTNASGTISASPRNRGKAAGTGYVTGPLTMEDDLLTLGIYIDRSLVEAFWGNSKSISVRSYSDFHFRAIRLEADGNVTIRSICAAPMRTIYS